MPEISPKALVMNPAGLAGDVQVGPFSYLGPHVVVGAGARIANHVTIVGRTTIGRNCALFPGCVVGSAPAEAKDESAGACTIGPENTIREHVTIEAGADAAGLGTHIGARNLIMVGCRIGHDAVLDGEGIFANLTQINHHARVEKFVRTSGFNSVQPYATVGAYTFTTGYVIVDRDAPPYAIVDGVPFRVRGVNLENLRRCGFSGEAVAALKNAFRILFDDDARFPDAGRLRAVEQECDDQHIRDLVAALRKSASGPDGCVRRAQQPSPGATTAGGGMPQ